MSKFSFNPSEVSIRRDKAAPSQQPVVVTMELEPVPRREYMAKFERYEPLIKDSTATKVYKTCPKKYFLSMVLGFNSTSPWIGFAWGSAYHKFRELLERSYGFGPDKPKQYDADKAKMALTDATMAGVAYWKQHGMDQEPGSKWAFMTTDRLISSFKRAFQHWEREKQRGQIEVVAVEQAFNVQLRDGSRTSGRFDKLVRWLGALWVRDYKTTSKDTAFFARQLEPNDQFTRYTLAGSYLAGEPVQGVLVELLYNGNPTKKETKGPDIFELTTSRTQQQLDHFERELSIVHQKMAISRQNDVWEKHEDACPFCPYHSVCTQSTVEGEMDKLEQYFVVRPWDNTKIGMEEE